MEIWIYTKDWTIWEIDGSLALKRLEFLSTAELCLKDTKKDETEIPRVLWFMEENNLLKETGYNVN